MEDLAALRLQLHQEQAARQQYEYQSAATTRQLWLLRDKHDREMRQLQDQLSVVRASLILVHKQQHMQQLGSDSNAQLATTAEAAAVSAASDDVIDTPRKGRQTPDQGSRLTPRQLSRAATPVQDAGATIQEQETLRSTTQQTGSQPSSQPQFESCRPPAAGGSEAAAAEAVGTPSTSSPNSSSSGLRATAAATAMQLLAAAAKLQHIVDQLTHREPAAAADLSVLQWQLTAAYGALTGAPGRSSSSNRSVCDELSSSSLGSLPADPAAVTEGTGLAAAAEQQPSVTASPLAAADASPQDAEVIPCLIDIVTPSRLPPATERETSAAEHKHQQSVADIASAAKLFSGAASSLQSAKLDWYYLDGSSIRGPYDPILMIRWYCSCYLEGSLPIAGVIQQADHTSNVPPVAAFEPLQELLNKHGTHTPYGNMQDTLSTPQPDAFNTSAPSVDNPAAVVGSAEPSLPVSTSSKAVDAAEASLNPSSANNRQHQQQACNPTPNAALAGQLVMSWDAVMGQYTAAAGGAADAAVGSAGSAEQMMRGRGCDQIRQQQQHLQQQQQVVGYPCIFESQQYTYETMMQQQLQHQQEQQQRAVLQQQKQDSLQRQGQQQEQLFELISVDTYNSSCSKQDGNDKQHKQDGIASKQQQQQQQHKDESSWSIAAVSRAAYAAYDVLEGVGNAVESAVTATVESVINTAESAFASQLSGELGSSRVESMVRGAPEDHKHGRRGSGTAFDFISDLPQLFPAAVMQDMQQGDNLSLGDRQLKAQSTHSSPRAALKPQLGDQLTIAVAAGGRPSKKAGELQAGVGSSSGNSGGYLAKLPGVWRVEGLHQMLSPSQQ